LALSALFAATAEEVKTAGISGEYIVPNGSVQKADARTLGDEGIKMQDRYYDLVQLCIEKDYGNVHGADHQDSQARGFATI